MTLYNLRADIQHMEIEVIKLQTCDKNSRRLECYSKVVMMVILLNTERNIKLQSTAIQMGREQCH